jgi:transposase
MKAISSNLRDFTGENIYVGMDVHHKSWKVHIYSDEFELKSFSQEPDVEQLSNYLYKNYKNANYQIAYEAGFCGFWIQRSFAAKGINCKVVHAADVPTINKERLRKTDKVDSKKIAKGLKNGELNSIHVPDIALELDRQLLRSRERLTRDSTRCKNRIKAILKLQGIEIPDEYGKGKWSKKFIAWLQQLKFQTQSGTMAMQIHLTEMLSVDNQKKQADKEIHKLSKSPGYSGNVSLLLTIPSIGLHTAMVLLTELGDIRRFKGIDELSSYCGIVPNCHSSGETEHIGGLSKRGNATIKKILIECAWIAVRKDPALLLYYKQQIGHMKGQKAIIKVARKLLSRIRYVLLNQQPYVNGVIS